MSAQADMNKLMEMGFSRRRAEKALRETGYHGVQAATEWLFSSEATEEESGGDTDISSSDEEQGAGDSNCHYISCDTCGLLFRGRVAMQVHASLTGHSSFREISPVNEAATTAAATTAVATVTTAAATVTTAAATATTAAAATVTTAAATAVAGGTEEKKPVTEEEKQEQKKKVEELIKQRRAAKEEQEKRETIEKEKTRRRTGQELMSAKQKFEEEEMKRLAEQRRREKLEAQLRKQQILDEIERDKIARREMFAMPGASTSTPSAAFGSAAQMQQQMAQEKKEYTECKLQIRLTNGECLTHTFGRNEELAAVRLYIQMNRTDGDYPFTLMTAFPRRVFKEKEMRCTLESLGGSVWLMESYSSSKKNGPVMPDLILHHTVSHGLVPSAVLIVTDL